MKECTKDGMTNISEDKDIEYLNVFDDNEKAINKKNRNWEVINKSKLLIRHVYSIISVLSTLTIFGALLLFLVGRTKWGNVCDDDLTMQRIQEQIPDNLRICEIYLSDIHGLGNDSLIVLTCVDGEEEIGNQLLIFDKIENDFLNKVNNFYGYGSNYRLKYKFSLIELDGYVSDGYALKILGTIDLTEDPYKEIVVKFMSLPPGNGVYYNIGIFAYSYEKHNYYLLGTFPNEGLYNLNEMQYPWHALNIFHDGECHQGNYYDESERFNLVYASKYNKDFFAEDGEHTYLIRTIRNFEDNRGNADPYRFDITVFVPYYDSNTNELEWEVVFSKTTDEYIYECTQEYVQNYLTTNALEFYWWNWHKYPLIEVE